MFNEIGMLLNSGIVVCKTCNNKFSVFKAGEHALSGKHIRCNKCIIEISSYPGLYNFIMFNGFGMYGNTLFCYDHKYDYKMTCKSNSQSIELPKFKIKLVPNEFDIRPLISKVGAIILLK